jgi:hypothetical protein
VLAATAVLTSVAAHRRSRTEPARGADLGCLIALAAAHAGLAAIDVFNAVQLSLRKLAHFHVMKYSTCTTIIEPLGT